MLLGLSPWSPTRSLVWTCWGGSQTPANFFVPLVFKKLDLEHKTVVWYKVLGKSPALPPSRYTHHFVLKASSQSHETLVKIWSHNSKPLLKNIIYWPFWEHFPSAALEIHPLLYIHRRPLRHWFSAQNLNLSYQIFWNKRPWQSLGQKKKKSKFWKVWLFLFC